LGERVGKEERGRLLFRDIEIDRAMEKIEITQQEIWAACRPLVQKNRKKYNRKKEKNGWKKESSDYR